MPQIIVAYTAGPYRSPLGTRGEDVNIRNAGEVAFELWRMGFVVICPHKNTMHFQGTQIPDDVWLSGCLELAARADIVVMLPGWQDSSGSRAERDFALSLKKPVYDWTVQADRNTLAFVGSTGVLPTTPPPTDQLLSLMTAFQAVTQENTRLVETVQRLQARLVTAGA